MKLNRNKSLSSTRSIASLYSLSAVALRLSETTMRMKSALTRALVLSIAMLGFLAAAPMASAEVINHSGTICKNSSRGDATFIDYLPNGTKSYKTIATPVICPLVRTMGDSNVGAVYVDLTHNGMQTTNCSAYSYNYDGTLLGSTSSGNRTFSGPYEILLDLSVVGKTNQWSDISVRCVIPGNGNAIIHGVDVVEY